MHPIAFHIGPMAVHWYGIFVALGYLASVVVMLRLRRLAGLDSEKVFDLSMITIVAGILGARLFYVVQFWSRDGFSEDPLQIIRIDKGGLVFYGGFICALLGVWLYCRRKSLPVLSVTDMMAPGLAIGHAFGRIGCFLQGCCFGRPTELPWAVEFPAGTLPASKFPDLAAAGHCSVGIHPVQIYESVSNFAIFGLLLFFAGRKMKPGCVAALYMVAYGVMRFVLEFFRGDHSDFLMHGTFTPSQTISLCFVIPFGLILFIILWRRKNVAS